MVNGGTVGTVTEINRPLVRCNQQVVVVLQGRDGNINEDEMEQAIEQVQTDDVSVSTRQARFTGDKDVVVATRGGIIREEQLEAIVSAVSNQIIQQNLRFQVKGWRVEA